MNQITFTFSINIDLLLILIGIVCLGLYVIFGVIAIDVVNELQFPTIYETNSKNIRLYMRPVLVPYLKYWRWKNQKEAIEKWGLK